MSEHRYRLSISCPDRVGIVAAVSQFISQHNGWISEANHHADAVEGWFYMRHEIRADSLPFDLDGFREAFRPIAEAFNMQWQITDSAAKKRVVLMVSHEAHCLSDLLYRWSSQDLDFDLVAIISNHTSLQRYADWHQIPFHHVPVSKEDKPAAFAEMMAIIDSYAADLTVLARYMQIIPAEMCERYPGRIINIHHSFLPSFVGARPYHQAYERGVKLVGATCHYVTEDLDAGPIIEQDVMRVRHNDPIEQMVRLGRDVEKTVLARGLRYHLEDRVLIHGNKTVVFS